MQRRDLMVQVDRVASVEEALAFCDAGANLIGVALDRDPRFQDARFVSPETAQAIKRAIAPARLVGHVPTYFDGAVTPTRDRIERVLALGPDFVQFYRGNPPDELLPMAHAAGIPIIRDGTEIDEGDGAFIDPNDPAAWWRDQLKDCTKLRPILFHLDVIPTMQSPWQFLTDVAPRWLDECPQISDIAAITRDLPFLLSLIGVEPDEIGPYTRAFPDARGFFARLGPDEQGSAFSTEPEPLLAALRSLQAL